MKQAIQNPVRAAALARRQAMSSRGKSGLEGQAERTRDASMNPRAKKMVATMGGSRRALDESAGGEARAETDIDTAVKPSAPDATPNASARRGGNPGAAVNPGKAAALARRRAQSALGKAGLNGEDSAAEQAAGIDLTGLSSREVARALREQRSIHGKAGGREASAGRNLPEPGRKEAQTSVAANASESAGGADELHTRAPGTLPGTTASAGCPKPPGLASSGRENAVTGNELGHSARITGDEPGSSSHVTGTNYAGRGRRGAPGDSSTASAQGRKTSRTSCGGAAITGDDAGSFAITGGAGAAASKLTGVRYLKSGAPESDSYRDRQGDSPGGEMVTGTAAGHGATITGDESGACRRVTGDQFQNFSGTATRPRGPANGRGAPSTAVTGTMEVHAGTVTGHESGIAESLTGTPYAGAGRSAQTGPGDSSAEARPDTGTPRGRGRFSVKTPSHAASGSRDEAGVNGKQMQITGSFEMARGKVTGTEDALAGGGPANPAALDAVGEPAAIRGRVKSRITGEGQDSGLRITGDDWERGDLVTGTEGTSALTRNPSRRGPTNAMLNKSIREADSRPPMPVSKVTGSSGNYEGGSLITYSGGARG